MVKRDLSTGLLAIGMLCVLTASPVWAGSKILATSGATQIEGAAGGGLVPWAVIGGYGSDNEWGAAASLTRIGLPDFQLGTAGVYAGFDNRFELSFAQQTLQVDNLDRVIEQQVYGAKARLYGDLIYTLWPQMTVGLQHKVNLNQFVIPGAEAEGTDFYFSASKLYLHAIFERNLLLNGTVRYTDANEVGFLGFTGPPGANV
jgi:hypothetical protein